MLSFLRRRQASEADHGRPASSLTGEQGEEAAAQALRGKGWQILDRNWRSGHLELDLVCREEGWLVFVEVKTRSRGGRQSPA